MFEELEFQCHHRQEWNFKSICGTETSLFSPACAHEYWMRNAKQLFALFSTMNNVLSVGFGVQSIVACMSLQFEDAINGFIPHVQNAHLAFNARAFARSRLSFVVHAHKISLQFTAKFCIVHKRWENTRLQTIWFQHSPHYSVVCSSWSSHDCVSTWFGLIMHVDCCHHIHQDREFDRMFDAIWPVADRCPGRHWTTVASPILPTDRRLLMD